MEEKKKILLVVDDESAVCRALLRLFRNKVDEILTAQTPADAEAVLHSRPVTHVICDHLLGPGQPKGMDIAQRWKAEHPTIDRIIILTGINVKNLVPVPGVDYVLPKTADPSQLTSLLDLD